MQKTPLAELLVKSKEAKLRLLKMHFEAKVGHLGGNLSCLDALMVLFHRHCDETGSVILSKGHSAGALYVTLWSRGILQDSQLSQFHRDGTKLAGHPAPGWREEIPFATGSLGHGLSLAAGMALGSRLRGEAKSLFCLTSDGEWQEGSTWEALIFACHHRLSNLTILIDGNELQGFGTTAEVASMKDLRRKLEPYDVEIREVDGHDLIALDSLLEEKASRPRVLFMKTTKGNGVSFMEGKMEWHYIAMNEAQYQQALEEVSRA